MLVSAASVHNCRWAAGKGAQHGSVPPSWRRRPAAWRAKQVRGCLSALGVGRLACLVMPSLLSGCCTARVREQRMPLLPCRRAARGPAVPLKGRLTAGHVLFFSAFCLCAMMLVQSTGHFQ